MLFCVLSLFCSVRGSKCISSSTECLSSADYYPNIHVHVQYWHLKSKSFEFVFIINNPNTNHMHRKPVIWDLKDCPLLRGLL